MNHLVDTFRLRISDFDQKDEILPSTVLDLFQDVAGKHAMLLKIGFEDLLAQNKIWIVLKTKYRIIQEPKEHCFVDVKTWPAEPGRVDAERYYQIYNKEGTLLMDGVSQWVVCDLTSRRIMKMKEEFRDIHEFESPIEGLHTEKLEDFDVSGLTPKEIHTSYLDLDHNGHINNAKYANYMLEAIAELQQRSVREFDINYVHELHKDSIVSIYYKKSDENTLLIKGVHDGETSFISKVQLF